MNRLFIFTAGNKIAREHLIDSISSPINNKIINQYIDLPSESPFRAADEKFYAWGAVPGIRNNKMWEHLNVGDYVLSVYDGVYQYISQCTGKLNNREMAKSIWGTLKDTDITWEYMYFLTKPEKISVPLSNQSDLLYSKYQGFTEISDARLQTIRKSYGSLNEYFTKEFKIQVNNLNKEFISKYKELYKKENLDNPTSSTSRKEQEFLKSELFKNKQIIKCGICNKSFNKEFVWCSHIYKRSLCTNEQRLDLNIVMPMCKFGCDDLYEKGYITILNGNVMAMSRDGLTKVINIYLDKIEGEVCSYWNSANEKYFNFHRKYHLKMSAFYSIDNCNYEFEFECPKEWSKLSLTDNKNVKFCNVCSKDVYLSNSKAEVDINIKYGRCIAVDNGGRVGYISLEEEE